MKSEEKLEGREVFNAAMLVDAAARRWGDRTAVYHYETGREITYKEIAEMVGRVGNALRDLGIGIEDRVAILMDDCPEWIFALFGSLKIGAVTMPLNTLLTEKDYAFFLADSRAKALFVGENHLSKVRNVVPSLPYLKKVVICGGGAAGGPGDRFVEWKTFVSAPEELEVEQTFSTDIALFAYTSGSTGRPRAIMHSHNNIGRSPSTFDFYRITEGDVQFHISKLYFLTSFDGLINLFKIGCPIVLLSGRPLGSTVLEVINRYRPNFIAGAPTIFARMVEAAKEAPGLSDISPARYIFCTGEPLTLEVFQGFYQTFRRPLYNCWGAQELCTAPLSWRHDDVVPLEKVGSSGKSPLPWCIVRLVDEHGNDVPRGTPGEIMINTASLFLGYWHEPQEANRKIVEGWYKPGDSFVQDEDGYYWYRGRLDDMVKVGGRQLFPAEIEETVARHPAVVENAVIPCKNQYGLTELRAFVVLKEGYRPSPEVAEEIKDFVKKELAPFKRPGRVEFVSELPRTGTGKIQRFRLKEMAPEDRRKHE